MRLLIVVLASALILVGVILAGGIVVRLCQEVGCLSRPEPTPAPTLEPTAAPAGEAPTEVPAYVGGMELVTPAPWLVDEVPQVLNDAPLVSELPQTSKGGLPGEDSGPTDACLPIPAEGLPTGTTMRAIGSVRLYPAPDAESAALAEYGSGTEFVALADESGVSAVTRCDVLWYLVHNAEFVVGWVLAAAVELVPPPITPVPTTTLCPQSGCVSSDCVPPNVDYPGCGQPCYEPCPQPCYQPCTDPCTIYPTYPPCPSSHLGI